MSITFHLAFLLWYRILIIREWSPFVFQTDDKECKLQCAWPSLFFLWRITFDRVSPRAFGSLVCILSFTTSPFETSDLLNIPVNVDEHDIK